MNLISLVPELNYWISIVVKQTPVNDTFHKIPTTISDYWRENNSVIELLFNENFHPDLPASSSSSSSGSDNSRPYIYLYRPCNLLLIPDKNILNRIQLYRWFCTVYAADSIKFINIFDQTGTHYPPTQNNSDIVYDSGLSYLEASSDTVPMLPTDVNEADRSPYITYTTKNLTTTNYPLVKFGAQTMREWPPPPPVSPPYNVFQFTDDDFMMLDMLYDYKVYKICNVESIDYNTLTSPLAKLVYMYLEAYCLNKFDHIDSEQSISDGTNILVSLYEKHVVDMICQLKIRQYGVIYKDSNVINNEIVEEHMYQFMIMKKANSRVTLTSQMVESKEVIITDEIPWSKADFVVFKDGVILEADEDYTLVLDFSNPADVVAKVVFLKDIFLPGENLLFIWSYVDPYSAYSEIDQ